MLSKLNPSCVLKFKFCPDSLNQHEADLNQENKRTIRKKKLHLFHGKHYHKLITQL